jgi:ubiquinone/menaquinone biosynthesis C-methylase UbiE
VTDGASREDDQQKDRIASIFGRAAATYDQVGPRFFAYYGRRLVELAQVSQGATVLDIGCGRGASLFAAAAQVGAHGRAIGIDLAESMVQEATTEIALRGLGNVEAQVMDAESLLFPDTTFDYVLCGFCLFFFPRLERALSETHRVLKAAGRIAVSTWGKTQENWQWLEDLLESYLPEPTPPPDQANTPAPEFETPQGMQAIMSAAGFSVIQATAESRDFIYATEEEWWSTQWSHGMRAYLERLEAQQGAKGLASFKGEAMEKIQAVKTSDGIHQVMPVLYTIAAKASGQAEPRSNDRD